MSGRRSRQHGAPVFVDQSGRRRRMATFVGALFGGGLLLSLALILAGLFGPSPASLLPGLPFSADVRADPGQGPAGVEGGAGRPTSPSPAALDPDDREPATDAPGSPSAPPSDPVATPTPTPTPTATAAPLPTPSHPGQGQGQGRGRPTKSK